MSIDTASVLAKPFLEAGLTQIRVHELASELSVSTQQVLSILEELGKKVRGPSTVIGVSAAAKVRGHFRAGRSVEVSLPPSAVPTTAVPTTAVPTTAVPTTAWAAAPAPPASAHRPAANGQQSLFLPPVAPAAAGMFSAGPAVAADPFAVPAPGPGVHPAPRPTTAPVGSRTGGRAASAPVATTVSAPVEDVDERWRRRGFDQAAQEVWCANGVRPLDADLADRCRSAGIVPTDLPRKLSGRTVLQRLRDGESTTSVWARIQEAEQQPRRAGTKLTGRFQLS